MGMHIKDLSKVRHDLSKVILLDNSTSAAAYQPTNLMTISSWSVIALSWYITICFMKDGSNDGIGI